MNKDLKQICGYPFPVDFLQLLAATLVKDKTSGAVLGFRYMEVTPGSDCNCEAVIDCDMPAEGYASHLPGGFGLDECGELALKLVKCKTAV